MKKTSVRVLLAAGLLLLVAGIAVGILYDVGGMLGLLLLSVLLNTVALTLRQKKRG